MGELIQKTITSTHFCRNQRKSRERYSRTMYHTPKNITRTLLIHAAKRWQLYMTANLWTYALRMENENTKNTPSFQDPQRRMPNQLFTRTELEKKPKQWIPFVCPAFSMETVYATSSIWHKWKQRLRVGIYLGKSP